MIVIWGTNMLITVAADRFTTKTCRETDGWRGNGLPMVLLTSGVVYVGLLRAVGLRDYL